MDGRSEANSCSFKTFVCEREKKTDFIASLLRAKHETTFFFFFIMGECILLRSNNE
jgi:hypothetical protein